MLIELEFTDDEKLFLINKWYDLNFEEVEMRIKSMNLEIRKLSKDFYNKKKRREYYS